MVSMIRRSAVLVVLGGMWAALSGESSAAQLQRVSVRATDDDAGHLLGNPLPQPNPFGAKPAATAQYQ